MKQILIFVFFLLNVVTADGQILKIEAPKIVAVGEPFSLIFSTTEEYENITAPDLSSLTVLAGPVKGQSNIQVNGQNSVKYTIQYYVSAKTEGQITIGKAKVKIGDKTITSNAVTIEVVKASDIPKQPELKATVKEGDVYADMELNYIDEKFIVSLKLYVKSGIGLREVHSSRPVFTGFSSEEIDVPRKESGFKRQNINDVIYNVVVLRRFILTPKKSGTLIIEPHELNVVVQVAKAGKGRDIFEDLLRSPYEEFEKKLLTPSISVNVENLSDNTGKFKI